MTADHRRGAGAFQTSGVLVAVSRFICPLAVLCLGASFWYQPVAAQVAKPNSPQPEPNEAVKTINMSRDLVKLGIAAHNLSPDHKSLDARPLFEAAVRYARNHDTRLLTVDHGAYYFLTSQDGDAYLRIAQATDLTVDFAASTIYFVDALKQGFALLDCRRVTLTNFRIDFQKAPYTHVRLEQVDLAGRVLGFSRLPKWADPSTFNGGTSLSRPLVLWAVVFRNGNIVPETSRMRVAEPIAKGALRLTVDRAPWTQSSALSKLHVGDTIIVTQRGGPAAVLVYRGDSVTISNASIYASSGAAVQLVRTSHSIVDHVRVMPRPGSGLISVNADGIHISNTGPNNHIRNCYITRTLDDAIAIDSLDMATVRRQRGLREITVNRNANQRFPTGTSVNFVDPGSGEELEGGILISQDPPDSSSPVFGGSVNLTFDRDLPALGPDFGMTFANARDRGAGSSIEDNVIEDVPFGRGIWVGGAEGVTIERNEIGHTSNGGIVVSQDTNVFAGPPAHEVAIRENKIVGSLEPMASGAGSQIALAAIVVESTDNTGEFARGAPNTNITIETNYIADSGRSGISLGELNGGSIRDNCVIHWNQHPELPMFGIRPQQREQLLQEFAQPVVVRRNSTVRILNNSTDMTSTCRLKGEAHNVRH